MMQTNKLTVLTLAALLLLPACQNPVRQQSSDGNMRDRANHQQAIDNRLKSNSVRHPHDAGNHDTRAIPSVDREKTRTTNEFGGTSYGLGSSVYSVIGSSGLHSQGLSSHLESRLSRAGLDGIRVFAVDDMVILATENRRKVAYHYDSLQQKLLGGTSGMSAIGPETGSGLKIGTNSPGDTVDHDNLVQAERWVRDNLGSVRIYTLTGRAAVKTIDRIRARAGSGSSAQIGGDIQKLLQMAMKSDSMRTGRKNAGGMNAGSTNAGSLRSGGRNASGTNAGSTNAGSLRSGGTSINRSKTGGMYSGTTNSGRIYSGK